MAGRRLVCLDPHGLGRLLADFESGKLDADDHPERESDLQRFNAHIDSCQACRHAAIEHVAESFLEPMATQKAAELGLSVADLMRHVVRSWRKLPHKQS